MILTSTSHIHLYECVERDLIWLKSVPLHQLEQIVRLVEHFLDRTAFKQSVESHFIRSNKAFVGSTDDILNKLNSTLDLPMVDAGIHQQIQCNFRLLWCRVGCCWEFICEHRRRCLS